MFLPASSEEMNDRGWDCCDVIIVTPDAYVDHPSFAMAVLGRFLESHGFRVGILSQPRWRDPESFLALGVPEVAFAVSGGNMDSMVLNYTANRRPRKTDLFSENGDPFFSVRGEGKKYRIRPDRTVTVYCSQIRSVCRGVPVIIGGIEASLRRIAHYDVWSNAVRRSILFDAKADLLVYGPGEYALRDAVRGLQAGVAPPDLAIPGTACIQPSLDGLPDPLVLPSFAETASDRGAFARAFCSFFENNDARVLAQQQDSRYLVQYPRRHLSTPELDAVYDLPYLRRPHPRYRGEIPAFTMIRDSITAHRGCFGQCAFCAIAAHQGTRIVSRSPGSVLREAAALAADPSFSGTITDVGGPSANMYACGCRTGGCERPDCLGRGTPCPNLVPGSAAYADLLAAMRTIPGIKHVFVSSGVRFDPVLLDDALLRCLVRHHVPGQMKVAPESGCDAVLAVMNKPGTAVFEQFRERFFTACRDENLRRYLIPYIIVGHPGEGAAESEETRAFLRRHRLAGSQFQIFTPTPLTRATAIYYLGFDPCTGAPVTVEKRMNVLEDRKNTLLPGTGGIKDKRKGRQRTG
ncbi:MAG: YgiQ family radical SAM protein [Methanomicrobiales archaeon]|nr:YgiQ family radical SAM protein [Methanomicrobiales archaeon]